MSHSGWETAYLQNDTVSLWQDDPIPVMSESIEALRVAGTRTVLDIGCGDGRNLLALAAAGFQCAGLDLSHKALGHAAHRLSAQGLSAFLLPGDAAKLPLVDESVDAVTVFDVFGQFAAPDTLLTEFERVLKPGGLLILNAFTTGDSEFGVGEPIGPRQFLYKDTLFRFFEEEEIRDLLSKYQVLRIDRVAWQDPPHGEFRPYSHQHENWVVLAAKRA